MKNFSTDFWSEHISNILSNDIYKNIIELLWNSFDADAFNVNITLEKSQLWWDEAWIISIRIEDDWHWLPLDKIEERFKQLWYSHKKYDQYSPLKRRYHWKKWQWRYSSLNLWKHLHIVSNYFQDWNYLTYFCDIDYASPKDVVCSDIIIEKKEKTWFVVEISNLNPDSKNIEISKLKEKIILEFADYIKTYSTENKISLFLNWEYIDIDEAIIKRNTFSFNVIDEVNLWQTYNFTWEIIYWKSKWVHNRYFCTEEWTVLWSDSNTWLLEKNFWHSIYVKWELLRIRYENNTHELLKWEPLFDSISIEVKNKLSNFFSNLLKENSKEFIKKLKDDNIYPYKDLPSNGIEETEREMYDVFLYKIHTWSSKVFSWPKESKQMILELIKTALEKDPKNIINILKSVVNLSKEELESLSWLINKFSLISLIKISKSVTDKLSFLGELDYLIHWEINKIIKERAHLHKILEQELWVFWDGYIEWTSDRWMKAVLEKHIEILWRKKLIENYDWLSSNIPDLFLYKQFPQSSEWKLKHLVIELKRPWLKITTTELNQLKKYALEVSNDTRFDKEKTEWEFVLVSNLYNNEVEEEITQENRPRWCAIAKPNYKVYVKTWGEVLQWLRRKYGFLKSQLQTFDETPENLDYIKQNLPDIYDNIFWNNKENLL